MISPKSLPEQSSLIVKSSKVSKIHHKLKIRTHFFQETVIFQN